MVKRGYGQFCPVAKAAEIFCERWNALLFRELGAGSTRFSELQRGVPLMSPSMLSRRLRELEREGIIERRRTSGSRSFTYHLTAAGEEFLPLVNSLGIWGQRWTRRQLREGEIDFRLLLWDMERRVDPAAFGEGLTVIRLQFTDLPDDQSTWWFVNDQHAELCIQEPGFEIDLYLSTTVPDLIHLWRGDTSLNRSLDEARLKVHGPRRLSRRLRRWLRLSPLAGVKPAKEAAEPGPPGP